MTDREFRVQCDIHGLESSLILGQRVQTFAARLKSSRPTDLVVLTARHPDFFRKLTLIRQTLPGKPILISKLFIQA